MDPYGNASLIRGIGDMSRKHALATDLLLDVIASFGNKVADLLQQIHGLMRSGKGGSAQLFQLFQLSSGTLCEGSRS